MSQGLMNQILVIEDEEIIRKQIVLLLERNGYVVTGAANIDDALQHSPDMFDIILADIRLPGASGTEIIQHCGQVPVVIMTSFASVRSAVESMKLGAVNYISKPFDHDELLLVIARSLHENRLLAQNLAMKNDLARTFQIEELTGSSAEIKSTLEQLRGIPDQVGFVYLAGERGVGKEVCARTIHAHGARSRGPMIFMDLPVYDTADISNVLFGAADAQDVQARQGMLHAAHAGTLVIRSVELLPVVVQQQLIARSLPFASGGGRSMDVRIIAISSSPAEALVGEGRLDAEFARLFDEHCYHIAPLRERREDVEQLAAHYLEHFVKRYRRRKISFSKLALNALSAYQWPGNVTELKNAVSRAVMVVDADVIMPVHLGIGGADGQLPLELSLDAYFRYFVLTYQDQMSETELASKLGISRKALWERRQKGSLPRG